MSEAPTSTSYQVNPAVRITPGADGSSTLVLYGERLEILKEAELDRQALDLLIQFCRPQSIPSAKKSLMASGEIDENELDAALAEVIAQGYLLPVSSGGDREEKSLSGAALDLDDKHAAILDHGISQGKLPANVACPVGCRFCYEKQFQRLFPALVIDVMPRYTAPVFDAVFEQLGQVQAPLEATAISTDNDHRPHYGYNCDFFAMGLEAQQIERLLAHNEKIALASGKETAPSMPHLYSTGYQLQPDLVERLATKYPHALDLWLSVVTFNDALKKRLVKRYTPASQLAQIIKLTPNVTIYLIHVDADQTLEDLRFIDRLQRDDVSVIIQDLHCHRHHAQEIQDLALGARATLQPLVERLAAGLDPFSYLPRERITFHGPPGAYVWKHREHLAGLFQPFLIDEQDVVLCSGAALEVVRSILDAQVGVHAVQDAFGGTTDFATTVRSQDVIGRIRQLQAQGVQMRRVFVPSSFWAMDGYDLAGESVEAVRRAFPELKIVVLEVPVELLEHGLSLEECVAYFESRDRAGPSAQEVEPTICNIRQVMGTLEEQWRQASLRAMFDPFVLTGSDVVVCRDSTVRRFVGVLDHGARFCVVSSTERSVPGQRVVEGLEKLTVKDAPLKRVFVVNVVRALDQSDFNNDALDLLQDTFPSLKVVVAEVPIQLLRPGLTVQACASSSKRRG